MNYDYFVARKLSVVQPVGLGAGLSVADLFPHQRDLASWAVRRGRAAIFADTGLGKSRMQLAWADTVRRETGHDVLILAPLTVAAETVAEGAGIGVEVKLCRDDSEVKPGITITNYDRLHRFDTSRYGAVVLDESSIIKHHDSKTLRALLHAFKRTPYKLCATATPAPNDWTELGTHAEFLGICTQQEMLSEFFVHDGGDTQTWRLKGHARREFWRWVASWAALVRKPSDLGHDDSRYNLPPLEVIEHHIEVIGAQTNGTLFAMEALTLSERRGARRESVEHRVSACAEKVNAENQQPWVVWCDLNAEGDALRHAIPGAVEIRGSHDLETKENGLIDFAEGRTRVLITKPSIAGFGLNWQHCARMAFVGVTDSFEAYYQAVRRCWRFGQTKPVQVHIFSSAAEGAVIANLRRKEADAVAMAESLSAETRAFVESAVHGATRETNTYNATKPLAVPSFLRSAA